MKIYKIACLDPKITDVYVGSTCDLKRRMQEHKYICNHVNAKYYNCKVYKFIREHGGWNNWKVYVLEELECNKQQAELREEHWRIELNATLNTRMCKFDGTRQEYSKELYEDNKEVILQKKKEYREANKEKIAQKKKQYREANKEAIKQYQKQYREANKEAKKQYQKQYREANKEAIKQYKKQYYEAKKQI